MGITGNAFVLLDSDAPHEAVRQRADVLAPILNGEYLVKRNEL